MLNFNRNWAVWNTYPARSFKLSAWQKYGFTRGKFLYSNLQKMFRNDNLSLKLSILRWWAWIWFEIWNGEISKNAVSMMYITQMSCIITSQFIVFTRLTDKEKNWWKLQFLPLPLKSSIWKTAIPEMFESSLKMTKKLKIPRILIYSQKIFIQ